MSGEPSRAQGASDVSASNERRLQAQTPPALSLCALKMLQAGECSTTSAITIEAGGPWTTFLGSDHPLSGVGP